MATVAYFTPAWPSSIAASGIASYVDGMANGVKDHGWQSVVLAFGVSADSGDDSVPVYKIKRPAFTGRILRSILGQSCSTAESIALSFTALIKTERVDLIEMEESFGWAAEVARRVAIPVIVRLHGPWCVTGIASQVPNDALFRERVQREGQGITAAAAVTAPSQNVLNLTREYYGLPLINARVIPNPACAVDTVAAQVTIPTLSGRVVLYVGRFERLKGGDLAVLAFSELAKRNADCQFVFIGPDHGLDQPDGSRVSITEFANRHFPEELKSRFHYLGQQPPTMVNGWRLRADAIIVTSRYENFPMALLEAMHAAKPVIATAVGGIPEIITHERTGLLVRPECVSSLVQATQRILDDPSLAAQLGQNACREVQQRFNLDTVVRQTLNFYDTVLRQWKSQHG